MLLALALSWGIIKLAVQQPVLTAHAHVGIRTAVRYYFERHVTVIPFWIPAGGKYGHTKGSVRRRRAGKLRRASLSDSGDLVKGCEGVIRESMA